jgi:hypothetical protein
MCLRQNSRRSRRRASSCCCSSCNGRSKGAMIVSVVRMQRSIGIHRLPFLFITVGMLATMVTMVTVTAYTSNSPKRESRYFAQETMLPPLLRIGVDGDNSVIPSRESSDRDLSVLYTNDPKLVSRWLSDNIGTDGCTLGFDLEVSIVLYCTTVHFCPRHHVACECSFIRCKFIRVRCFITSHPSTITSHHTKAHAP